MNLRAVITTLIAVPMVTVVFGAEAADAGTDALVIDDPTPIETITPVEARIADSRVGGVTFDGAEQAFGRLRAGDVEVIDVVGRIDVAAEVSTIVVNLTAVRPADSGYLTAYDCATTAPTTSNLNFSDATIANVALVGVSGGSLCVVATEDTDLVIDLIGTFSDIGADPTRVVDTRRDLGLASVDATSIQSVDLAEGDGPVLANVTVTGADDAGWLSFACDREFIGQTSAVNFDAGETIANFAVFPSQIECLEASTSVEVIVDVVAQLSPRGDFQDPASIRPTWSVGASRISDTRVPRFAGRETERIPADTIVELGAPFTLSGRTWTAVLNLTVIQPDDDGHLTLFACSRNDAERPPTVPKISTMNFSGGDVIAHQSLVSLDPFESYCVWSTSQTDLVVDRSALIDHSFDIVVRAYNEFMCSAAEATTGTTPLADYLTLPADQPVTDRIDLEITGIDGPFTVTMTAPDGWAVELDDQPWSRVRGTWTAPRFDAGAGPFDIDVTITDSANRVLSIRNRIVIVDSIAVC